MSPSSLSGTSFGEDDNGGVEEPPAYVQPPISAQLARIVTRSVSASGGVGLPQAPPPTAAASSGSGHVSCLSASASLHKCFQRPSFDDDDVYDDGEEEWEAEEDVMGLVDDSCEGGRYLVRSSHGPNVMLVVPSRQASQSTVASNSAEPGSSATVASAAPHRHHQSGGWSRPSKYGGRRAARSAKEAVISTSQTHSDLTPNDDLLMPSPSLALPLSRSSPEALLATCMGKADISQEDLELSAHPPLPPAPPTHIIVNDADEIQSWMELSLGDLGQG